LSPASTGEILEPLRELYPQCRAATDVLELALLNLNPYVHSAAAILSIAGVEGAGEQWRHYVDGITPSTAKVMRDLDRERVTVCEELGYRTEPIEQLFHLSGYAASSSGDLLVDMTSTAVLREERGPFDISYRYLHRGYGRRAHCCLPPR
jgi:opine dehydrogenase